MAQIQEIKVEALPEHSASFIWRLRPQVRKILSYPLLHLLLPWARRVRAVMQPTGRVSVKHHPRSSRQSHCQPITIISANLCHDWPRHRQMTERLEAFARLAERKEADVILLQEVTRTPDLWVDQWLAGRLGMAYVYSRANGDEPSIGFEEGLAVFSHYPIQALHVRQLDRYAVPLMRRMALGATVDTPCGKVLAVSAHLSLLPRQNAEQINHLHKWVNQVGEGLPALVGGDFNAHETTSRIGLIKALWIDVYRHLHPHADGTSHELRLPWGNILRRARLDYIFLKPGVVNWEVLEAYYPVTPHIAHSDHRAMVTRLRLQTA